MARSAVEEAGEEMHTTLHTSHTHTHLSKHARRKHWSTKLDTEKEQSMNGAIPKTSGCFQDIAHHEKKAETEEIVEHLLSKLASKRQHEITIDLWSST